MSKLGAERFFGPVSDILQSRVARLAVAAVAASAVWLANPDAAAAQSDIPAVVRPHAESQTPDYDSADSSGAEIVYAGMAVASIIGGVAIGKTMDKATKQ